MLANGELTISARASLDEAMTRAVAAVQVPRVFSTVGLPDVRRIELWESHNAAALIGLSCHTTGPDSLEATELNLQIDQVHLARVAGSAHVVERTAGVIRRTPADAIAIYLTLRGDAWFEDEGGRRTLRPGNVLICEAPSVPRLRRRRDKHPPARPVPPSPAGACDPDRTRGCRQDSCRCRRGLRFHLGRAFLTCLPRALRPARRRGPAPGTGLKAHLCLSIGALHFRHLGRKDSGFASVTRDTGRKCLSRGSTRPQERCSRCPRSMTDLPRPSSRRERSRPMC